MNQKTQFISHIMRLMLSIALALILSACPWDEQNNNPDLKPDPPIEVSAVVEVVVLDRLGAPLANVEVTVDGVDTTANSDASGRALLAGLPPGETLTLRFQKTGYAAQVKPLTTLEDDTPLSLEVALLQREAAVVFAAAEEAKIVGKHGATVSLPEDAFVDAQGNPVGGEIEVTITPVDVSTTMGLLAFPGEFAGILPDGSNTPIVSFGSVEYVFTQGGAELALAPGVEAIIELPMYIDSYPDGTAVQVGDNIPLWSLDESTGTWMHEGEGTVIASPQSKTGLAMRASATHFSWWNTDWFPAASERVFVTVDVIGEDKLGNVIHEFDDRVVQVRFYARGYRENIASATINSTLSGQLFKSVWCFQASFDHYTVNDDGERVSITISSQEQCKSITQDDHIELRLALDFGFKVDNRLRATATVGTPFNACGDRSQIAVQSYFPVTFTRVAGLLPEGLTLEEDGRITGIPEKAGTYNFQVDVETWYNDGTRNEYEIVLHTIEVSEKLELETWEPPYYYVGNEYLTNTFTRRGGLQPYQPLYLDANTIAAVPEGTTFEDGTVEGTPERLYVGSSPAAIYVANVDAVLEDQNCAEARAGYNQWVLWGPLLSGEAPLAEVGRPYSFTLSNSEGPVETWSLVLGEGDGLPPWASLNPDTGEISGTPEPSDVDQEYVAYIRAQGPEVTLETFAPFQPEDIHPVRLNVFIKLPELAPLDDHYQITAGQPFSLRATNIGAQEQYWEVDNLPDWASFDTTNGTLSGTPSNPGTYSDIRIRAVNAGGSDETRSFSISVTVGTAAPQLSAAPAPASVGVAYGFTVSNSGGAVSRWTLTGTLPPGLAFSDGTITGTPTAAGNYSGIDIEATNAGGADSVTLNIEVARGTQAVLRFTQAGPIVKRENEAPFTNAVLGGSGTGALSFTSSEPTVASVASNGEVTLHTAGETEITAIKAADANFQEASASYTLQVEAKPSISGSPALATLGGNYSWTPQANLLVDSWFLDAGALPPGLSLDTSSGEITGFPSIAGQYYFTLGALSGGEEFLADFTIVVKNVACLPGSEGFCSLVATLQQPVNYQFGVAYVTNPTWSIINGSLPPGLSLNTSTGEISGSPTVEGLFNFQLQATNGIDTEIYTINLLVNPFAPT